MSTLKRWSTRELKWIIILVGLVIALFLPQVLSNKLLNIAILILFWGLMSQSWNIVGGLTGQISIGHAAFFGVGAYTAALLVVKLKMAAIAALLIGGAAAVVLAIPMGLICFRLREAYFVLTTVAVSEILRLIATSWDSLTNGAGGLTVIVPDVFVTRKIFYYVVLFLVVICTGTVAYLMKSRAGYYMVAVREDEKAAEALGINVSRYKLLALCISAGFTGIAGAFYAYYTSYLEPDIAFSVANISVGALVGAILGGIGTLWGPLIGSALVIIATNVFRTSFSSQHLLIYGFLLVVIVVFMPEGIIGGVARLWRRLKKGGNESDKASNS